VIKEKISLKMLPIYILNDGFKFNKQ